MTAIETPVLTKAPLTKARRSALTPRPKWWLYIVLTLGGIAMIFPFIWMILGSFKTTAEIRSNPLGFLPENATLDNYTQLFGRLDFTTFFMNSAIVALFVTLGNIVFSSMVGYALAKLEFRGKKLLFVLVLGTLMVPGVVTFVPLFVLTSNLGLVNSYPGLILPFLITPLGVFLMRQFISSLPDDILEAARIDGASEGLILRKIVLPTLKPVLITLALFIFLGSWNDFMWPLIVLADQNLYTLPVALAALSREHVQDNELMMAGSVITVLPVLVLFLALQRHYLSGLMAGSVKG